MTSQLLREENVEYSLLQAIKEGLPGYGFTLDGSSEDVHLREAFPTPDERQQELAVTTVAFGFNIDDGGRFIELGSNLTEYVHTMLVWVFATEPRFGRRVAHSIKHIMRLAEAVPLHDYNEESDPVIDHLTVNRVQVQHQINNSVRPWDQYVWTVAIAVADYFLPEPPESGEDMPVAAHLESLKGAAQLLVLPKGTTVAFLKATEPLELLGIQITGMDPPPDGWAVELVPVFNYLPSGELDGEKMPPAINMATEALTVEPRNRVRSPLGSLVITNVGHAAVHYDAVLERWIVTEKQ